MSKRILAGKLVGFWEELNDADYRGTLVTPDELRWPQKHPR